MKLYYYKTDGGAEYLCSSRIPDEPKMKEGDLRKSDYVIRIDGNPEMIKKNEDLSIALDIMLDSQVEEFNELTKGNYEKENS